MSGKFLNDPKLQALSPTEIAILGGDRQLYSLLEDFSFESGLLGLTIKVPLGYVTDFASIPRIAFSYIDPEDPAILFASIIHDYLYSFNGELPNYGSRAFTRLEADRVLIEGMEALGARWDQKAVVFAAVRAGGWLGISHWQPEASAVP